MNAHPDQAALVRREAEKSRRHMPLRKLVAEAPDVLLALAPCWMASPLSVSQLLPADRKYFDLLLVDEASQILPEDAVPSMLRAGQAVVAGDRNQLPPTTFFAAGEEESP
jgi:superfamily I DNA and/or RNA helicase